MVLGPIFFPPGAEEFDAQAGEVVQLLQVEALAETIHEAVLRVQAEAHGPQDLRAVLAQVVKSVHKLLQVWVRIDHVCSQNVIEAVGGTRETKLHLLTPGQLRHLATHNSAFPHKQPMIVLEYVSVGRTRGTYLHRPLVLRVTLYWRFPNTSGRSVEVTLAPGDTKQHHKIQDEGFRRLGNVREKEWE